MISQLVQVIFDVMFGIFKVNMGEKQSTHSIYLKTGPWNWNILSQKDLFLKKCFLFWNEYQLQIWITLV